MYYDKDKTLQKEFSTFWEELTTFEEEEDNADADNEVLPYNSNSSPTSSSVPNLIIDYSL